MCGICGIIDYRKNNLIEPLLIEKMCSKMNHRGPDDSGVYINNKNNPCVGLGHRRLNVIDLSAKAHQPMCNEDQTIWIVFNGEVYNFIELRNKLLQMGHKFRSHSDSEVMIHLYEEYGDDCILHLRGMFAFAIWDEKMQKLLLARDRIGKKPLLYYYKNGVFCFASEFLSLLESGLIAKDINLEAINCYLTFGYIPAPMSVYKNVFKLLPAHRLILKNQEKIIEQYWELDYSRKLKISETDAIAETQRLLKEAVEVRLHSDVPLGAFLSGGIDSSAVVALMSQLSTDKKVKTFSIGFEEKDYSELKYAANIAKMYNTEHHEFIVKPKALEILPLLVERYGEPYADSSCVPSYYVAQQTRKFVTVALNGDGGDELFAGYERYQGMIVAEAYQKLPFVIKNSVNGLMSLFPDSINSKSRIRNIKRFFAAVNLPIEQRYFKWMGIIDDYSKNSLCSQDFLNKVNKNGPFDYLSGYLNQFKDLNLLDRLLKTDVHTSLPNDFTVKMDIACSANSLEARSPFLDHKLMEFVVRLPATYKMKRLEKKYILKKVIQGIVPRENIYRRKTGFGVPVGEWFRNDMKEVLIENLTSDKFFKRGYFEPERIKTIVGEHIHKSKDHTFQLWALLMLELWHQRFID